MVKCLIVDFNYLKQKYLRYTDCIIIKNSIGSKMLALNKLFNNV